MCVRVCLGAKPQAFEEIDLEGNIIFSLTPCCMFMSVSVLVQATLTLTSMTRRWNRWGQSDSHRGGAEEKHPLSFSDLRSHIVSLMNWCLFTDVQ